MIIDSPRNPAVVAALRLRRSRQRRATGLTLLEGPHLLREAAVGGAVVERVFAAAGTDADDFGLPAPGTEWVEVSDRVLERIAPTDHPRGPVAVVRIPDLPEPQAEPSVVLWQISDPGNAGTLLRTAVAFDLQCIVVPGTVDVWSPKVLRAAAGGHFRARLARLGDTSLDALIAHGLVPVAAVVAGGADPAGPVWPDVPALLVGDEAHGLNPAVAESAAQRFTIPMPGGTESLNVAAAGAILMYELARHRRGWQNAESSVR
jgi:TrmH family RNA methyltransferase